MAEKTSTSDDTESGANPLQDEDVVGVWSDERPDFTQEFAIPTGGDVVIKVIDFRRLTVDVRIAGSDGQQMVVHQVDYQLPEQIDWQRNLRISWVDDNKSVLQVAGFRRKKKN